MSGILDKKSRVLDAILTVDGRRQMAEGTFEVSYVTFSDLGVSYIPDPDNGHEDPTNKIYLEACCLPHDQITFEANDTGKLVSLRNQNIVLNYDLFPSDSSNKFVAQGKIEDGSLYAYRYFDGRFVRVTSRIEQDASYNDFGFFYVDKFGTSGSILVDTSRDAGTIVKTLTTNPVKASIGIKKGISPENFATSISGAIASLKASGGPSIDCFVIDKTVYFDETVSDSSNLSLFLTGTNSSNPLSSKLVLRESSIGGTLLKNEVVNANFASSIQGILTSSFDNFVEHQTISSANRLFEDDQFELSVDTLSFDLKANSPNSLLALNYSPPKVDSIDSLFNDDKMSHLDNFLYLPPIVKTSDAELPDKSVLDDIRDYALADYPSWGDNESKLTYSKLMTQLSSFKDVKAPVVFTKTSLNNRLIGQIFEVTSNKVNKLDVVDFGEVTQDMQDGTTDLKRVFFAGKTYIDDRGTVCFVNMFTLIFSTTDSQEA